MLPRGSINAVQINRNQPCTTHSDGNIGDSFTIVFGDFKGGVLEIDGEHPHHRTRVWRRYDGNKLHRVTGIKSGIRVSITAFRRPERPSKVKATLAATLEQGRASTPQEPCSPETILVTPVPEEVPQVELEPCDRNMLKLNRCSKVVFTLQREII